MTKVDDAVKKIKGNDDNKGNRDFAKILEDIESSVKESTKKYEEKFGSLDESMKKIDSRLEETDKKIEGFDKKLEDMNGKSDKFDQRLKALEEASTSIAGTVVSPLAPGAPVADAVSFSNSIGFIRALGEKKHEDVLEIEYSTITYAKMLEKHGFSVTIN